MRSRVLALCLILTFLSAASCKTAVAPTFEGTATERTVTHTFHCGMGWYNKERHALTIEFLTSTPPDDVKKKIVEKGTMVGFDKGEPRVEVTIFFNDDSAATPAKVRNNMISLFNFSATPMSSVNSGAGPIDALEGTPGSGAVSGHLKGQGQLGSVSAESYGYDLTFRFNQ